MTSPPATITLSVTVARAPLSITLVAIWNDMPLLSFSSKRLPPFAWATESPLARIVAVSSAVTATSPSASIVMLVIDANAPPRTSLREARPEAAVASAELRLVSPRAFRSS